MWKKTTKSNSLLIQNVLQMLLEHPSHAMRTYYCRQPASQPASTGYSNGDPVDADDDVHALLLGTVPLVAEGSVLLRVPEGADGAVHSAAACDLRFRGRTGVLDNGAVGDVLVGGLGGLVGVGGGSRLFDEGLEEVVLGWVNESAGGEREREREDGVV